VYVLGTVTTYLRVPVRGPFDVFVTLGVLAGIFSFPFTVGAVILGLARLSRVDGRDRLIMIMVAIGAVVGTFLCLASLGLFYRLM
jgi:hypothetical protein